MTDGDGGRAQKVSGQSHRATRTAIVKNQRIAIIEIGRLVLCIVGVPTGAIVYIPRAAAGVIQADRRDEGQGIGQGIRAQIARTRDGHVITGGIGRRHIGAAGGGDNELAAGGTGNIGAINEIGAMPMPLVSQSDARGTDSESGGTAVRDHNPGRLSDNVRRRGGRNGAGDLNGRHIQGVGSIR